MRPLPAPPGYRHAATPSIKIGLRATSPDATEAAVTVRVNIACDDANPFHFQLETMETHDRLDIRETDLAPDLGTHLELLLELWVDRHLTDLVVKRGNQAGS